MKFLKYFFIVVIILVSGGIVFYLVKNEPLPEGKEGKEAALILLKIFDAIHFTEWQKTAYISWTFAGKNQYVWDKKNNVAQIKWDDMEVILNTVNKTGLAVKNGEVLLGMKSEHAINDAWKKWCNDSFWLNAPAKILSPGVGLKSVNNKDEEQLLVTFTEGGVTPGDSYLWKLDELGMPVSFKMWVSSIPFGGTKATWEGWTELSGGAKISTIHKIGPKTIKISDLKDGSSPADFGLAKDFFDPYH